MNHHTTQQEITHIMVVGEIIGNKHCTTAKDKQRLMKRRPSLLRSPPSIQVSTYTAHAHTINNEEEAELSPPCSSSSSSSTETTSRKPSYHNLQQPATTIAMSRTQHKILLQRQSFLADDKNYLDHPDNMRRLTKELDRVNREYRYVKQFQDPFALSIKRVIRQQQQQPLLHSHSNNQYSIYSPTTVSSAASSLSSCNSYLLSPSPQISNNTATRLQRRTSSNTVHDYLLNFKDQQGRRHSFSFYNTANSSGGGDKPANISPNGEGGGGGGGLIGRIFFGSSTTMHHSPFSSFHLKQRQRHPHVA